MTSTLVEDILKEMAGNLPIVSEINETPKYTVCEKVELRKKISLTDASESLKILLGEPKILFAEPVLRNQEPTLLDILPEVASMDMYMDDQPWEPDNHLLTEQYIVQSPEYSIMPQTQLIQESQQSSLLPPAHKICQSFTSSTIVISPDSNSCSSAKAENSTSDKGVVQPVAISPLREEEQEKEPKSYLKNFLKNKMSNMNIMTRVSHQVEPVGLINPKPCPSFPIQESEVINLVSESSESESNHSDKPKSQADLSSLSSKDKYNLMEKPCDNGLSYSSHSHASSKPFIDLNNKYSKLPKSEINYLEKSFVKPAKLVKRKSIPELVNKEEPVVKKRNKKKASIKTIKPPLPLEIKSKPLISSNTGNDNEPVKKRRGRPPNNKSKVISARSKLEEYTDCIPKSQIKDSERKSSYLVKKKKIMSREKTLLQNTLAEVSAALSPPHSISTDEDYILPPISTVTGSPPKLDLEGIKVMDKNKSDTLRKLFGTRIKGGKGDKGKIIIIDNTKAMLNDNIVSSEPDMPNNPINEGLNTLKLSLMCKIQLSSLPPNLVHLVKSEKSEEPRTSADLANTRKVKKKKKLTYHRHHNKRSPSQIASGSEQFKSNKFPINTAPPTYLSSDDYSKGMVDNVDVWNKPTYVSAVIPEAKVKPSNKSLEHSRMPYLKRPAATSSMTRDPYKESSKDKDGGTRLFSNSATAVSNAHFFNSPELDQYTPKILKRRKFQYPTAFAIPGTKIGDELINDLFVDHMHEVPVEPPRQPSWGMQFSHFDTDLYPKNNMSHKVPLKEAQKLAKLAEYEPDPITQEMKYLDGILCFILCGHLMENDGSRERDVLKMYNDTFNSIKVLWLKIYNYNADCDYQELDDIFEMIDSPEKDNRLLIIWMRCISFLRFQLYKFPMCINRKNFETVRQHFKNVVSSLISPVSVKENHSLGYFSSSITHSSGTASPRADQIEVPVAVYSSMHSVYIQHSHLAAAFKMSQCADLLAMRGKHRQFFAEIDQHCGRLSLSDTGHSLTLYARIAISRLRCEFNIINYLSLCQTNPSDF